MSGDLYEENLWGKIDYLHERYQREHNHINNFLDMISRFQMACLEFSKQITSILGRNYILSESNASTLYKSMENFYKLLLMHSEAFKETFESIKINLSPVTKSISESFEKEKVLYNAYLKARTNYSNSKEFLERLKKEFNQKGKECEILVYNAKKAKIYQTAPPDQINKMENKATEVLANTALVEDRYVKALNEANKSREYEIQAQKKLQIYYHNVDTDYYGKIRMMTGFFVSCLKRMYNKIFVDIEDLNKSYTEINIEYDIKEFVDKNKTSRKPDAIIKFIPFKPAPELVSHTIMNANTREPKNLIVSYEVVVVFQKLFKFIRTDLNMEEEEKKNNFRIITSKLFSQSEKAFLTQNEINEIITFLKDKTYRNYLITMLTRHRTKTYKKSEKIINDLAELFNFMLEVSEKDKDFEIALNCIILGQTFYYEKLNKFKNKNDKKYLIEGIKGNEWVNTVGFWEGIINLMIIKEVGKSEYIKNNDKDKREVFNKICYTQIFNYANIMLEFNINKNEIIALVEKLSPKYQLKKEDFDLIMNSIKKDKKIEKKEEKVEKMEKFEKVEKDEENEEKENDEENDEDEGIKTSKKDKKNKEEKEIEEDNNEDNKEDNKDNEEKEDKEKKEKDEDKEKEENENIKEENKDDEEKEKDKIKEENNNEKEENDEDEVKEKEEKEEKKEKEEKEEKEEEDNEDNEK